MYFYLIVGAAIEADKACLLSHICTLYSLLAHSCTFCGSWAPLRYPNELQIAVTWWLALDISRVTSCALCPDVALDPLCAVATKLILQQC